MQKQNALKLAIIGANEMIEIIIKFFELCKIACSMLYSIYAYFCSPIITYGLFDSPTSKINHYYLIARHLSDKETNIQINIKPKIGKASDYHFLVQDFYLLFGREELQKVNITETNMNNIKVVKFSMKKDHLYRFVITSDIGLSVSFVENNFELSLIANERTVEKPYKPPFEKFIGLS